MGNSLILSQAILKAEKNGFNFMKVYNFVCNMEKYEYANKDEALSFVLHHPEMCMGIIFNHDFAKAFFGLNEIEIKPEPINHTDFDGFGGILDYTYDEGGIICWVGESWKYHLQQMVLQPNPYLYLEKFINE